MYHSATPLFLLVHPFRCQIENLILVAGGKIINFTSHNKITIVSETISSYILELSKRHTSDELTADITTYMYSTGLWGAPRSSGVNGAKSCILSIS